MLQFMGLQRVGHDWVTELNWTDNANKGLSQWLSVKESVCNVGAAGDLGLIPGLGRFPGVEHSNPLQYSFLESPEDRGAWQAIVRRVAQCQTWLKQLNSHTHMTNKLHLYQLQSIKLKSPLTYLEKGLAKCQMNISMLWKTRSDLSFKVLGGMFENETERNLSRVFKWERDWDWSLHEKHGWRKENHQRAFPSVNNSEIENKYVVLSEFIISVRILWSCILDTQEYMGSKFQIQSWTWNRGKFTWKKTNFSKEDGFLASKYCLKKQDIF